MRISLFGRFVSTGGYHSPHAALADQAGANRAYAGEDMTFTGHDGDRSAPDGDGRTWAMTAQPLAAEDGRSLPHIPAQCAFWGLRIGGRASHGCAARRGGDG